MLRCCYAQHFCSNYINFMMLWFKVFLIWLWCSFYRNLYLDQVPSFGYSDRCHGYAKSLSKKKIPSFSPIVFLVISPILYDGSNFLITERFKPADNQPENEKSKTAKNVEDPGWLMSYSVSIMKDVSKFIKNLFPYWRWKFIWKNKATKGLPQLLSNPKCLALRGISLFSYYNLMAYWHKDNL